MYVGVKTAAFSFVTFGFDSPVTTCSLLKGHSYVVSSSSLTFCFPYLAC